MSKTLIADDALWLGLALRGGESFDHKQASSSSTAICTSEAETQGV